MLYYLPPGVRIKYFHKIWADDVLIVVAWLMLCVAAILYQTQSVNLYNEYSLATGRILSALVNMARKRTFRAPLWHSSSSSTQRYGQSSFRFSFSPGGFLVNASQPRG